MATKVFPTEMSDRGTVLGTDKLLIWNSTTGSSEEYTTVTKLTKAVDDKISASQGNLLGGIAHNAAAPTPAVNGRYVFTSAGSCTWITGGAVTVAVNDEVLVTYTAPSTYVYTFLSITANYVSQGAIKQAIGTSTTDVMSQNAITTELVKVNTAIGELSSSINISASNVKTLMADGLNIKTGDKFSIKIAGSAAWSRIILYANGIDGTRYIDHTEGLSLIDTEITATEDTTKLYVLVLFTSGSMTLTITMLYNLTNRIGDAENGIIDLIEEQGRISGVLEGKTATTFDTRVGATEKIVDYEMEIGDIITVEVINHSTTSSVIIIRSLSENSIVIDTFINNETIAGGATAVFPYTPASNTSKLGYLLVSGRSELEINLYKNPLSSVISENHTTNQNEISNIKTSLNGEDIEDLMLDTDLDTTNGLSPTQIDVAFATSVGDIINFDVTSETQGEAIFSISQIKANATGVVLFTQQAIWNGQSKSLVCSVMAAGVSLRYALISGRGVLKFKARKNPYKINALSETYVSTNVLDMSSITEEKYLKPDGVIGNQIDRAYTDYIRVDAGDVVIFSNNKLPVAQRMRFVTAYDVGKNLLADKGSDPADFVRSYIVPNGVFYIRVTTEMITIHDSGARINLKGKILEYEPYYSILAPIGVNTNTQEIKRIKHYPLSELPDYMLNINTFRPLGALDKGYLCISDDDGTHGLATYTIPMVLSKNVPVTFFIMHDSEIFSDVNETAALIDAVDNHGCSVAAHGSRVFTDYTEYALNQYFISEREFMESKGLLLKGACYPTSFLSKIAIGVVGGNFGVARCGYDGYDQGAEPKYKTVYDLYYSSYARSNMFCLSSVNVLDYTVVKWQEIIDWAIVNKRLLNIYFHDFNFVETDANYLANRAKLETVIDYAKTTEIEFINFGDIPNIK